jgi:glycine cleavage system H protein
MSEKKFSKDHEWIDLSGDIATVGITNHAQSSLGDIVFVDLPEIGKKVVAGAEVSVIESVKAASDIYSPVDGEIFEINEKLSNEAALVNEAAETEGWIFKIKISNPLQLDDLMNLSDYEEFLKQE